MLLDYLDRHVQHCPDRLAFHFPATGASDGPSTLTYRGLRDRADAVAGVVAKFARPGDRAILALPPGPAFLAGLFGLMRAGVVAVPAFPPSNRRAASRLQAIADDCSPRLLLLAASRDGEASARRSFGLAGIITLHVGHELPDPGRSTTRADCSPTDPAILQYTSGSTSEPKGVVLSHANLLSNCLAMASHIGVDQDQVGVSWLPPYHDMGLIGTIMLTVYGGWSLVMLSPEHFVQRPVLWLRAITEFAATITVSPTFGLDMCVRRIDDNELQGIDLRSLRLLFCGAEPVDQATLHAFRDRFAAYGYRESVLVPTYGLAEATLMVTAKRPGEPLVTDRLDKASLERGVAQRTDNDATEVVSCGAPPDHTDILIVDPDTRCHQPDGTVGEIWISGPGVGSGYWGRPTLSDSVFRAAAAAPSSPRRYLRSGDLGYSRDNMLFVTGRISDLIVISGRNLHPQDIERSIERGQSFIVSSAAFALRSDVAEGVVVVVEIRGPGRSVCQMTSIEQGIAASVGADHGVRPSEVVLVFPGSIPRTTSGKKRRAETRSRFLAGTLRRFQACA